MDDQNIQQIGQNPLNQPVQIPEKPTVNYLTIGLVVIFVCFVIFGFGGYYLGTQTKNKIPSGESVLPTLIVTSPSETPTVFPTNTPTIQPTAVTSVSQSITLKVAAIGGGAGGERYDYAFTFNADPEDKIVVLKRDINEVKNYPAYNQGAFDKGLVIKHGTVDLEIIPAFEGAGSDLLKKKIPVTIVNSTLTDASIYRINHSDIFIPEGSTYKPRAGAHYTVAYKENPAECRGLSSSTPACIWSQPVTLRDGHNLYIYCSAEDNAATWCDNIVRSLNVSVSKYSN